MLKKDHLMFNSVMQGIVLLKPHCGGLNLLGLGGGTMRKCSPVGVGIPL